MTDGLYALQALPAVQNPRERRRHAATPPNVGGRVVVRAIHLGAQTLLARITALVEEAQTGKAAI
jgi:cation transport ATPase